MTRVALRVRVQFPQGERSRSYVTYSHGVEPFTPFRDLKTSTQARDSRICLF